MSMAEVKALPWYEHELLLEGLYAEFTTDGDSDEDEDEQGGSEEFVPMSLDTLGIKPTQM